jgi:hypothetical protein
MYQSIREQKQTAKQYVDESWLQVLERDDLAAMAVRGTALPLQQNE